MSAPRMSMKEYEHYLARIHGKNAAVARPKVTRATSTAEHSDASGGRSCASSMTRDDYRRALDQKNGTKIDVGSDWSGSEKRYFYGVLGGKGEYEAETIRFTPEDMESHVYTPDFVTHVDVPINHPLTGKENTYQRTVFHEVKGNYSFKNQGEARLRFCWASMVRPDAVFVWAKESASRNRWSVEVWFDGGRRRVAARGVIGYEITPAMEVTWRR